MVHTEEFELLDFLAEVFLQQGASVSYKEFLGIPVLEVSAERAVSGLYVSAEAVLRNREFLEEIKPDKVFVVVLGFRGRTEADSSPGKSREQPCEASQNFFA